MPDPAYPAVLGRKLANLCITLNEHPCIRFQVTSAYSKEMANSLHQTLMQFKRANPKFWCQVPHTLSFSFYPPTHTPSHTLSYPFIPSHTLTHTHTHSHTQGDDKHKDHERTQ
jgi:hypothetical protein